MLPSACLLLRLCDYVIPVDFFLSPGDSVRLELERQAPSNCQADLMAALNLADVTADFRCSDLIEFSELSPDQAVFSLSTPEGNPQLVQYLRHSLSEVGDGFFLEVIDIGRHAFVFVVLKIINIHVKANTPDSQARYH